MEIKGAILKKEQWEQYKTVDSPLGDYVRKMDGILGRLQDAKTELIEYLRENGADIPDGVTLRDIADFGYIRTVERKLMEQEAADGYKPGE